MVAVAAGWAASAIVMPMAVAFGRTINVPVWVMFRNTDPRSWQDWQVLVMPPWPVGPIT